MLSPPPPPARFSLFAAIPPTKMTLACTQHNTLVFTSTPPLVGMGEVENGRALLHCHHISIRNFIFIIHFSSHYISSSSSSSSLRHTWEFVPVYECVPVLFLSVFQSPFFAPPSPIPSTVLVHDEKWHSFCVYIQRFYSDK